MTWSCPACATANAASAASCVVCGQAAAPPAAPGPLIDRVPPAARPATGSSPPNPQGFGPNRQASAGPVPPAPGAVPGGQGLGGGPTVPVVPVATPGSAAPAGTAPGAAATALPSGRGPARAVLIGVVAVVVALAVGIAAALVVRGSGEDDRAEPVAADAEAPTAESPTAEAPVIDVGDGGDVGADDATADDGTVLGGTGSVVPTSAAPVVTTTSTTPPTTRPPDPGAELRAIAAADVVRVRALDGYWVPQVSSKQVGLEADGITYDDGTILLDHRIHDERWGDALLFWSGDVGSFKHTDWWVTVIDAPSPDGETALAWCHARGLDRDHCYAKQILLGGPVEHTTLR